MDCCRVFGLPMEDEEGDDDGVQQHTESEGNFLLKSCLPTVHPATYCLCVCVCV